MLNPIVAAVLLSSTASAQELVAEAPEAKADDIGARIIAQTWESPLVQECFAPLLRPPAIPPGLVEIQFTLDLEGKASDIRVVQKGWHGSSFETCLRAAIPNVTYDKPEKKLDLTLPFNLEPPPEEPQE